ncbi:substrate-binding domain-containing protein [Paenibacillus validus]|uniref:Substrate-binding domain-containing protein n=2 Tax=Paenibacillus TaxID=44249 RepID=A0A7X2Z6J5_9BACL|nr:substrate-binding domain-containing protein [Paenibacillus validus]
MKRSMVLLLSCLLFVTLIFSGCSGGTAGPSSQNQPAGNASSDKGKKIVVGVSIPDFSAMFFTYLLAGAKKYAESQTDVNVIYNDAQNDANKQVSQVETFIAQKVNAIVIIPVDTVSAPTIVEKANQANIPIIIVNRTFDGIDKATAYVGGSSIQSGTIEMEQVAKLLNGKGNIAIMDGTMGAEAQIKRTEGNMQVITKYPDMKVVLQGSGDFDRAKGMSLMENWLNSGKPIDAVVANNDEMAIGAINAIKAAGKMKDILVAGIDATPDALEFIKSGELKVTVFQDAYGQGAGGLEAAIKAAKGEHVEHDNFIPYQLVTKENVEEYVKKWK